MKEGGILWGWLHCVQQQGFTQAAIDKRLTLIAWEVMHKWWPNGDWQMHIFHKNNELAGYAGVLHALNLDGIDGNYGPGRQAVVISFGSVSRGAIFALKGRGWHSTQTVWKAIEVQDGVIQNSKILSFQEREAAYPDIVRQEAGKHAQAGPG